MNGKHRTRALAFGIVVFWTCGAWVAAGADEPSPADSPPPVTADTASEEAVDADAEEAVDDAQVDESEMDADEERELPRTPEQKLWEEFESLLDELHDVRVALADAELRAKEAEREAHELRQFIEDRREYGEAYEEYRAMRTLREREMRQKRMRETREQYEKEREERLRRVAEARAERDQRRAERRERRQFEEAGFTHLGLNVYSGQMAYTYRKRDVLRTRVRYSPVIGRFLRPEYRDEIDFTEMIISGSVVNASDQVRNIGVAVTFFDERGNQVGNEIVQVNNARPGVPYPFTSTIKMALDRPFTSTTSYVLFADPVGARSVPWQD